MRQAEALAKWQELLLAARAAGPVVQAVVELHTPEQPWNPTYAECQGCNGTIQGDSIGWPEDCSTSQLVARHLGIELKAGW